MTLDILGAIPCAGAGTGLGGTSRRTDLADGRRDVAARPDGSERAVARVTAWLLATSDTADAATDRHPPLVEGESCPCRTAGRARRGISRRSAGADSPTTDDSANVVWLSPLVPLVDAEPVTELQRLAMVVDSANGAGAALDPEEFMFMNTDTDVHLHRLPVGNDFALRARGSIGPDGIGVTTAELFDRQGFIGTSAQTLAGPASLTIIIFACIYIDVLQY